VEELDFDEFFGNFVKAFKLEVDNLTEKCVKEIVSGMCGGR
jgi:hypothetical protein